MKKYWYFTALVTVKPVLEFLSSLSQEYYVSAVVKNANAEGLFTFGVAHIKITELLEKDKYIRNSMDIDSVNYLCIHQVPEYEFEHEKASITRK